MNIRSALIQPFNFISKKIRYLNPKIESGKDSLNSNGYEDLTPVDDVKQSQNYLEALNWGLQNPNVKNIALSGPYGSGKSSILRTFEKKFPKYSYLKISLASFQDEAVLITENETLPTNLIGSTSPNSAEDRHQLIELSILQQMFYRVKGKAIPDSRFNRIQKISRWRMTYYVIVVLMTILGISLLLFPAFYDTFAWYTLLHEPYCDWPKYIGILFSIPAIVNLSAFVFRLLNTSKFNKINLIKGEVELDPKSETSILNKHLDEILYFFQVTRFNVIFIEDLDRFNDPEIFTKLREMNLLINNADQIIRKVTFVYAIKDDMFKDKTRTKFFDFIIPVIPVINSSNSYEQMHEKIFHEGSKIDIKENFLSNVTLYIDDMRALKNIYNEFMLYRSTLNNIKLKDDQLFAMIVYKNMYPNDFAKLHHHDGILYNVFNDIGRVKEKFIARKNSELDNEKRKLIDIEKSCHLTINELRSSYLVEMLSGHPTALGLVVDGQQKALPVIRDDDQDFLWLTNQTDISYYYFNNIYSRNQNTNTGKSFNDIQKKVNPEFTYLEREADLKEHIANGTKKIEEKISTLKREIHEIRGLTVSKLLNKEASALNEFDNDFSKENLLVYLVRNGYINENYLYLISYFYPGSLSINDANFALSVANRENQAFDLELTKIAKLLERLTPEDFKEEVILNFQLANYIAEHPTKYKIHLENLMGQFNNEIKRAMNFYDVYIDRFVTSAPFIRSIFKSWNRLGEYIVKDSGYTKERVIEHLRFISRFGTSEDLNRFNINNCISNFVASSADFMIYFKENSELTIAENLIKSLNIKFVKIEEAEANQPLFDYIYKNNCYKINRDMITLILRQKSTREISNYQIDKANLTTIRSSDVPELLNYIEENLDDYVNSILIMSPENTEESEETIIWILNKVTTIISHDQKLSIIRQQKAYVKLITSVSDKDIWANLLEENKIFISWYNVISYFEKTGLLDEILIAYLSQYNVYHILKRIKFTIGTNKSIDIYHKFSQQLLTTNGINDAAYLNLLDSNPYHYPGKLSVENLSEIKLSGLIKHRIIRLNKEMFELLRKNFSNQIKELVEVNIVDYQKKSGEFLLELDEFNYLLKSSNLSTEQKKQLITELTHEHLAKNNELAILIGDFYANLPYQSLNWEFFNEIFKSATLKNQIILFEKYLRDWSHIQIKELIEQMGHPYSRLNIHGKQTKLPLTNTNQSIIKQLEDKNYVRRKTKIEKDIIRVYNILS
ncbi:hypothetical protein ACPPVU_09940 [Mucilaginibacter sp. McL0603]|uniref:YobI family P-loop NTPase n=1 Tax=Mucilaginibacter sp. McL0603 TaxID=3415670 RepID=UPI003CEA4AD6